MDGLHLLLRMAENNLWSNFRLHRSCAELSEAEYQAPRTSFFPSLKKTLEHIYMVDLYYLDSLERGGKGRAMYAAPDPTFERLALLTEAQLAADRRVIAFVASLKSPAALDERVVNQRPKGDHHERIGDVLQHLFVHQIHHRGQAHAMLSGTQVKPPQLDEFFLSEDRAASESELRQLGLPVKMT